MVGIVAHKTPRIVVSTYTPTLSNTTNITGSTAYLNYYFRIGNVVFVAGRVDIDPTAAAPTATLLRMSVPIASAFANQEDAGGTFHASATDQGGRVRGEAGGSTVEFAYLASNTAAAAFGFSFAYRII